MKKITVLITGANGEVGHGLISELSKKRTYRMIALYRSGLDKNLLPLVEKAIRGDISERNLLEKIIKKYNVEIIFHLAAILSTGGEKDPETAQKINVEGTVNLLEIAQNEGLKRKKPLKFIFPSSIAAYGFPDIRTKVSAAKVTEEKFLNPITMYGVNKLYCEHLGEYFAKHYRLLSDIERNLLLDFRCVRFPGLISATTLPTGGTSDFAPEMIHAAAQGKNYECFVRPDSEIPFMAMPDGVAALIKLAETPRSKLKRIVYNIRGFSVSAEEIAAAVKKAFPGTRISYKSHARRQKIVDSWPRDVDDSAARRDWGWQAKYDFQKAFTQYLVPTISQRYKN